MLDIESLALKSKRAMIATVGYAVFAPTGVVASGHLALDLEQQSKLKRDMEVGTVMWWLGQEDGPRSRMLEANPENKEARARQLNAWQLSSTLSTLLASAPVPLVWAAGPQFDIVNLETLFDDADAQIPWKFYNVCDQRLRRFFPEINRERTGLHDAEADAVWQAEYLIELNRRYILGA